MLRKLLILFSACLLLLLGSLVLFIAGVNTGVFGDLPHKDALRSIKHETASLVYSEDGRLIGKFFAQNRTNIGFEEFPPHLIHALIATEDARYFEHKGVDYRSLMRVFFKSLLMRNERSGGGSTLSQQLAKNLYGRKYHGPLSLPVNKVKEAILAGRIEDIYSKEEVITLYLNTVPFGENVFGVEAAAIRFFNRSAKDLSVEQSAVLVGMLKANTFYNPRLYPENALRRRNVVLGQMEKYQYLAADVSDSLAQLPIGLNYADISREGPANYFLVRVKQEVQSILQDLKLQSGKSYDLEKDGLIITTTLNHQMQQHALDAFRIHLSRMQPLLSQHYEGKRKDSLVRRALLRMSQAGINTNHDVRKQRELYSWQGHYNDSVTALDSILHDLTLLHAGLVAIHPQTGAIKTWVGGIDFRTQPYDQVTAKRQLASAFKPILFSAGLEAGLTPCSWLSNDTLVFKDHNNWTPRNYDHSSGGKYSMAGALAKSANLPAVSLLLELERENLEALWSQMGFASDFPEGPSVALGSASGSALELCVAYAAIANGGYRVIPTSIEQISTADGEILYQRQAQPERASVLSAQSAMLMQWMMQKVVRTGTATSLHSVYGIDEPIAAKTGTSQDYADAWFGAFTPQLVVVSRVGASLPEVHFSSGQYGSGSKLALPLVGIMLREIRQSSDLKHMVFAPFPQLPPALEEILDCPDYQEPSAIDSFKELFRSKRTTDKQQQRKSERKQRNAEKKKDGLLQRLFNKDKR
ncbi:MAG: penicillin-binding protein [Cryomorphaceae bacterium]|nr:MAG: penicillin-binding protein [Cryomorphaceae bacterium]